MSGDSTTSGEDMSGDSTTSGEDMSGDSSTSGEDMSGDSTTSGEDMSGHSTTSGSSDSSHSFSSRRRSVCLVTRGLVEDAVTQSKQTRAARMCNFPEGSASRRGRWGVAVGQPCSQRALSESIR